MHPGFFHWWHHARHARAWSEARGCGPGDCGPGDFGRGSHGHEGYGTPGPGAWAGGFGDHGGDFGHGPFGVRRPLRFLAHKLGLEDEQVEKLARILSDLKTERAQTEVDTRRSIAAVADVIDGESFDRERAAQVAADRTKAQERMHAALVQAFEKLHAVLTPEQRHKLAYLIRTGALLF